MESLINTYTDKNIRIILHDLYKCIWKYYIISGISSKTWSTYKSGYFRSKSYLFRASLTPLLCKLNSGFIENMNMDCVIIYSMFIFVVMHVAVGVIEWFKECLVMLGKCSRNLINLLLTELCFAQYWYGLLCFRHSGRCVWWPVFTVQAKALVQVFLKRNIVEVVKLLI